MRQLTIDPKAKARASLALSSIAAYEQAFASDPKNLLASTLLSKQDFMSAITKRGVPIGDPMVFNTRLSHEIGPITSQLSSGRCWLFSACNLMRISYAEKFNLPEFELSQAYLFFC